MRKFILLLFIFFLPISNINIFAEENNLWNFKEYTNKSISNTLQNLETSKWTTEAYNFLLKFREKISLLPWYKNKKNISNEKIQILNNEINNFIKEYEEKIYYKIKEWVVTTIFLNKDWEFYYNWYKTIPVNFKNKLNTEYKICYFNNNNCRIEKWIGFQQFLNSEQLKYEIPDFVSLTTNSSNLLYNQIEFIYVLNNNWLYRHTTNLFRDYEQAKNSFFIWEEINKFSNLMYNKDAENFWQMFVSVKNKVLFNKKELSKINVWNLTWTQLEKILRTDVDLWKYDENNTSLLPILDSISKKALELTKWLKTDEEKIKVIYKYIIDNVEYDYELYNEYIQNWNVIEWRRWSFNPFGTFNKWMWVCSWYSSLFQLMLSIAGVKNVEYVSGYYYNPTEKKLILHAWNKIWNKYYDLTFDDGLWADNEDFYYYWIPEDMIMVERLYRNQEDLIKKFETSHSFAQNHIDNKLKEISKKYSWKWYKLTKAEEIFNKNQISKKDTLETIYKNLPLVIEFQVLPDWDWLVNWITRKKEIINWKEILKEIKKPVKLREYNGYLIKDTNSLYNIYLDKNDMLFKDKIVIMKNLNTNDYILLTKFDLVY